MKNRIVSGVLFIAAVFAGPFSFAEEVPSRDIEMTIELPMGIDRAWPLWTENQALQSWLAPRADVVPRLDGSFEVFWDLDHPDQNSTLGCKILGVANNRFLAFEWRGPVEFADVMNVKPFPTWVMVEFEKISATKTLIHFRHSGWQGGDRWSAARNWQTNAWEHAFAALAALTGGKFK
jgi:uncharacterized protein YndB with AHSA1/START domain